MRDCDPDRTTERARREFLEMPGLSLTVDQAARLWQIPHDESSTLLARLVDEHFLHRAASGHYRRVSSV